MKFRVTIMTGSSLQEARIIDLDAFAEKAKAKYPNMPESFVSGYSICLKEVEQFIRDSLETK